MQALNDDGTVFAEIEFNMSNAARNRILDAYRQRDVLPSVDPNVPAVPIGRKAAFKRMSREFVAMLRQSTYSYRASVASRDAIAALTVDPEPVVVESADDA
mgnify:CR=1 FL=1